MGEAFITRRGGGGGAAGLNFEIVGGTTQPSNPKENTIWINTAQKITSWDFAAEMPFLRSNNKNKIVYPFYHTTKTESGITWTDNKDGSITANGTAASDGLFRISAFDSAADHEYLEAGTYTLSGCPAGGSDSTYLMELFILNPATNANEAIGKDYGEGFTFTLERGCKARINLNVISGATVSGITFKPQIEKGSTATAFVKGDATGQVWISTGTSSTLAFNALKKNGIQVYPISAKQYVSGAWVDVEAKSYQGGEWVEWWNGDLYAGGNEFEYITGGWVSTFDLISWNNTNVSEQGPTKSGESITLKASNLYSASPINTKNKINVTPYKTLSIDIAVKSGYVSACLTNTLSGALGNGADTSWMVAKQDFGTGTQTATFDLSGVNREVYIVIYGIKGVSSDPTAEAAITRVNLR